MIQKPHLHFNGFAVRSGFSVLQEFGFPFFFDETYMISFGFEIKLDLELLQAANSYDVLITSSC